MKSFVKFVVVVALIALVVVELGSPLWTRPGLAGAADDAASAGARDYFTGSSVEAAQAAAASAAKFRGTTLTEFSVLPDGNVHVTVFRHASPRYLERFSPFKNWYKVKATATAAPH